MTDCTLCGLPTPDPPVSEAAVPGSYCCRGCLEVARVTDDPADADADRATAALDAGAGDRSESPPAADGEAAVEFLAVEGMHCATCEAFLEARATEREGVLAADASYPTGAVKLTYDPSVVDASDLPDALSGTGYRARGRDEDGDGDDAAVGRLLVGSFFGMMTMLWYVLFLYPAYLGVPRDLLFLDPAGPAGAYLLGNLWVMTTVVVGYTGWPLLRGAVVSLRAGQPNMDLLVAVAATTAYLYSAAAVLLGRTEVYFDVATVVVLAVTLGDYYRDRVRRAAVGRLSELTEERVDSARRRTADGTETVPLDRVEPGDQLVVRSGERVPVDGAVREGPAAVTNALVTGEALPERRRAGDEVVAGALVTDGALVVEVGPEAESTLDRLLDALWSVRSGRDGVHRLVDRVAAAFVPLVLVLAVGSALGHLALGAQPADAMLVGLAVLVVSCPCALGLATPLAVAAGTRAALADGVVVTDGSAFETAADVDVVAFDKTGTLTTGAMRLVESPGDEALARAAAVEQFSSHPVAAAVVDAAGPVDATVGDFESFPGRGVGATVDGERVLVGHRDLFEREGWAVPEDLGARFDRERDAGRLPALVGWNGRARDLLVAADEPRPGWEAVLRSVGADRDVVVLTGDDPAAADRFRDHPAVDEVFAGVPPEGKSAVVERLRDRGTVAMVGDGSNDAPALAAADLGVAFESGTELAADAADCVVTGGDLGAVPRVFEVTDATRSRIRQNLGWAFCYNAVAVPLAVAGVLNPLFAAAAMATSSLLVVGNSARSLGGSERNPDQVGAAESEPLEASVSAAD